MKNPWEQEKKLSFKKAFLWILFSTILISGTTSLFILYYFHFREIQLHDKRYNILSIIQTGKNKERLSTEYLAEILELSSDTNSNLFGYQIDAATKRLINSPLIKSAKVHKVKPDSLSIEYTLRTPLYCLKDYSNTGIDADGVLIPLKPFFENYQLVEVCLGNLEFNSLWGEKIPAELLKPVFEISEEINHLSLLNNFEIRRIDVSRLNAPSLGDRQIILVCNEIRSGNVWYFRLRESDLPQQLLSFAIFFQSQYQKNETPKSKVIDLRLPNLAFIQDL
jgi:hypothetical protein